MTKDNLLNRVEDFIEERESLRDALALDAPQLMRAVMQFGSLREASRECGLSPAYLSSVLNGKTQISMHAYVVLSRYYERVERAERERKSGAIDTAESADGPRPDGSRGETVPSAME